VVRARSGSANNRERRDGREHAGDSIGNLSTVWLIANVRETDARMVSIGQPVEVRVLPTPAAYSRRASPGSRLPSM